MVFTSEFIQFIEYSDKYEFELFRNLPLFVGKNDDYHIPDIKGILEIKTRNKINKIDKNFLLEKLKITAEKYINENKCEYLIKYEYNNLPKINWENEQDYIPSSKIFFLNENNKNEPLIFYQKSLKQNQINYCIIHKLTKNENEITENEYNLNPALFIFLIDQSGSMRGHPMKVASKALILFLQSLPSKSYYQIIGFGSDFVKYDKIPREYTQKNIKESIKFVEQLKADLGGTDIYSPLKDIYNSSSDYEKIKLHKNIFLLTDGGIGDKSQTLQIIERNNKEFSVYSIGIGDDFDKDLIKNAGILGKGNYNFCNNIESLNEVIVDEIKKSCGRLLFYDYEIKCNLEKYSLFKIIEKTLDFKFNQFYNENFILDSNDSQKFENDNGKINVEIKYKVDNKEVCEKYEIIPMEIQEGEEISKLIMNEYLYKNKNLDEKEKTELSLKYEILTENTSLFAEINLSEKITEELKTEVLGAQDKDTVYIQKQSRMDKNDILSLINNIHNNNLFLMQRMNQLEQLHQQSAILTDIESNFYKAEKSIKYKESMGCAKKKNKSGFTNFFTSMVSSVKGLFSKKTNIELNNKNINNENENDKLNNQNKKNENNGNGKKLIQEENNEINSKEDEIKDNIKDDIKDDIEEKSKDKKDDVREIINSQNFVEGYWDINENTEIIKEKYEKEFNLLKNIKNLNINDKIAITILMIYYINKEHPELLKELSLIILKAKNYIKNNTKDTYENIVKEINI